MEEGGEVAAALKHRSNSFLKVKFVFECVLHLQSEVITDRYSTAGVKISSGAPATTPGDRSIQIYIYIYLYIQRSDVILHCGAESVGSPV